MEKVDLGDGRPRKVWFVVDRLGVEIRAYRGRRRWFVPLAEAAAIIGRRGQLRAANLALKGRADGEDA